MKRFIVSGVVCMYSSVALGQVVCPYDSRCIDNAYGAGSPYKSDGLMNPNSEYGNKYSNKSWTNPNATDAPKIYDQQGNYRGRLSNNPNDPDSISNPNGRYGNKYSPDSIRNQYGAGAPHTGTLTVVPQKNEALSPHAFDYTPVVDPYINPQQALGAIVVVIGAALIGVAVKAIWNGIKENYATYKERPKQALMTVEEKRKWGQYYLFAPADRQDFSKANELLTEAANAGDPAAMFSLATMYRDGRGVPNDDAEAFKWYQRAADAGDPTSAVVVADSFRLGKGVARDDKKSLSYYKAAAELGDSNGMYSYGVFLANGIGAARDDLEGAKWLKRAADLGNQWGQFYIGYVYLSGRGVPADVAEAVRYLGLSREQGNAYAGQLLGNIYETGIGIGQDIGRAIELYRWASERNNGTAAYRLGYLYELGSGVEKDVRESVGWYKRAADLGAPGAKLKVMMLERGL